MDSCCFIDVAKYDLGRKGSIDNLSDKEDHILACIQILDLAKRGQMRVLTGNITISECQHLSGFVDENVKRLFQSILTSGRVVRIVADSIFIAERARNLMWDYNIRLGGADAHHVATALESKCGEFITSDSGILKWAADIERLGLKVIRADQSKELAAARLRMEEPESPAGAAPSSQMQTPLFPDPDESESEPS